MVGANCNCDLQCGVRAIDGNTSAGDSWWGIGAANITFLGIDSIASPSLSAWSVKAVRRVSNAAFAH